MKRMAIIFNSDYQHWPMGGMITYVVNAISLLKADFELDLWGCAVDGEQPRPISIDGTSYPIHANTKAKTRKKLIPNVVKCFWGNLAGSTQFQADRYDILYFHLSASMLGWFLGEKLKHSHSSAVDRPLVILHQHGMAYGNTIGDRLDYLAMDRADMVFFTTDKNSLERHKAHVKNPNVVWMPSMVDTDFFYPVSPEEKQALREKFGIGPDKKVFIYTGRITGWKNPLLLLDAFEIYQRNNDGDGYLIYVGDGDCISELEARIKEKRLEDAVRLTGKMERSEIRTCLQAADVFVLPSKGEGVSVSALEAMAAGLPVTAFDVEGMSGFVEEQSGVLVGSRDSAAFAAGMEQAARGHFMSRDVAEAYSMERVRDMMVKSIENALERKGKSV